MSETESIKIHLDDGRVEYVNCSGERHRTDGPALIASGGATNLYGYEEWWVHGKRHRIDGPAKLWSNGIAEWWFEGVRHRIGGPAITGTGLVGGYWLYGIAFNEEADYNQALSYLSNR